MRESRDSHTGMLVVVGVGEGGNFQYRERKMWKNKSTAEFQNLTCNIHIIGL